MKIPISDRLLACCKFIHPGDRIADIGCDHGYLSIYLLTAGIARCAIASDVRKMPLARAVHNAEKYGVRDQIRFCLSDGVQNIPRDFDTMICAGMGADTIISILEAAPWLRQDTYRLVLQCQSKPHLLRNYLSDHGWSIREESVLRDGRFLYTVMEVVFCPNNPRLTVGQWYISPAMLSNPTPETAEYCQRILKKLRYTIENRGQDAPSHLIAALSELEKTNLPLRKEQSS